MVGSDSILMSLLLTWYGHIVRFQALSGESWLTSWCPLRNTVFLHCFLSHVPVYFSFILLFLPLGCTSATCHSCLPTSFTSNETLRLFHSMPYLIVRYLLSVALVWVQLYVSSETTNVSLVAQEHGVVWKSAWRQNFILWSVENFPKPAIVTSWRLCLWHTDKHIPISCQNSFMYVLFVLLGRWTLNYRRSLVYSCWHFRSLQWSWYIYLKLSRDRECYIMLAGCCKATSCFYCMTRSAWEASTMTVPDFDSATCGSLWQCWISHLNKVSERVLFINKQADAPTRDWTRFGYKCG